MKELKRCPFCGKKPFLAMKDHEDFPHAWYFVICDYGTGGCGAESAWCRNEQTAIMSWNMRVGDAE